MRITYPLGAALLVLLFWGYLPGYQNDLILDRTSVLGGEVWRLFTGHFVHLNLRHFVYNVAGAGVMVVWAWRVKFGRPLMLFTVIAAPLLSLLLLAIGANWYAGLSGLLHGVLVLLVLQLPRPFQVIGIAIILAKLAWQQWLGGSGYFLEESIPVSMAAHWIGAGLGLMFFAALRTRDLKSGRNSLQRPTA